MKATTKAKRVLTPEQIAEEALRQEWETPPELFDAVDAMFYIGLDVCASKENRKCLDWIGLDLGLDALKADWFRSSIPSVWCNPPFGAMDAWLAKALEQVAKFPFGTAVVLSPIDTSTRWWNSFATQAAEIWFLTPRVKLIPPTPEIKASNGPVGAHCLLVYRHLPSGAVRQQAIVNWRWKSC